MDEELFDKDLDAKATCIDAEGIAADVADSRGSTSSAGDASIVYGQDYGRYGDYESSSSFVYDREHVEAAPNFTAATSYHRADEPPTQSRYSRSVAKPVAEADTAKTVHSVAKPAASDVLISMQAATGSAPSPARTRTFSAPAGTKTAKTVHSVVDPASSGSIEVPSVDFTKAETRREAIGRQLPRFFGVSFTQTFVELGVFAVLEGLGMDSQIANVFAICCSCAYGFMMHRKVTFKSSSNFARSVTIFIGMWVWNLVFCNLCLTFLPGLWGWDTMVIKLVTMCCQGIWGFLMGRYVIFK